MNFEASTAYHRLSTELALFGVIVLDRLEIPVDPTVLDRLESALGTLELITAPSGLFPPIGDDDSGLVVGLASQRSHREGAPVIGAGRRLLGLVPRVQNPSEFERWACPDATGLPKLL